MEFLIVTAIFAIILIYEEFKRDEEKTHHQLFIKEMIHLHSEERRILLNRIQAPEHTVATQLDAGETNVSYADEEAALELESDTAIRGGINNADGSA